MAERMVGANAIEIWTEDFGDPASPTVLLVMGAGGQAILWPDGLIDALVAGGKHVIRYDNRDVGQTTCFDFATDPYTVADMAADAVAVLDAYGVGQADIVGASMGGMIVQTVALNAPDRVRTMTSIMSTPLAGGFIAAIAGGGDAGLPGPEQKVRDLMVLNAAPPSSDDERIDRAVLQWRALAGTMAPFDEEEVRDRERRILARAKDIDAANNHQLAVASSPDRIDDLARIAAPTLVIHGTLDPILPYAHGEATARRSRAPSCCRSRAWATRCRRRRFRSWPARSSITRPERQRRRRPSVRSCGRRGRRWTPGASPDWAPIPAVPGRP